MTLDEAAVLRALQSGARSQILGALSLLKTETQWIPTEAVVSACLSVLTHSREDDVQSDVIFALGLHWQSARLYPEIMRMLADRAATSSVVVGSAIASLSALARSDAAKVPEALSMLAQVTADKAMSAAIRATAYSNALRLAKKITSREFAGLADNDIASMDVDWPWVNSLAQNT